MAISTTFAPNAPAAKTGQGSAIGNREDLSSELTILAPEETPILSMCSKGKATSTFHEWTVDTLDTPSTAGISEGTDVSAFTDKFAARARLGNYVQIHRRDYLVSNLQNAVTSVGPANVAQAEAKAMRELKRDIEATIASNNELTVENGAGVPYGVRGLGKWIQNGAQATNPVPSAYRTPTASVLTAALTESTLNDLLGSIYTQTGETGNLTMVANVALRKVIANFARIDDATTSSYVINEDAGSRKITLSVSLFDSDFGTVRIVTGNPACMPTGTTNIGYVLDPKYLGYSTLIPMGSTRLENKGGGERGFVDCTGTLLCKTPLAHGKIAY